MACAVLLVAAGLSTAHWLCSRFKSILSWWLLLHQCTSNYSLKTYHALILCLNKIILVCPIREQQSLTLFTWPQPYVFGVFYKNNTPSFSRGRLGSRDLLVWKSLTDSFIVGHNFIAALEMHLIPVNLYRCLYLVMNNLWSFHQKHLTPLTSILTSVRHVVIYQSFKQPKCPC